MQSPADARDPAKPREPPKSSARLIADRYADALLAKRNERPEPRINANLYRDANGRMSPERHKAWLEAESARAGREVSRLKRNVGIEREAIEVMKAASDPPDVNPAVISGRDPSLVRATPDPYKTMPNGFGNTGVSTGKSAAQFTVNTPSISKSISPVPATSVSTPASAVPTAGSPPRPPNPALQFPVHTLKILQEMSSRCKSIVSAEPVPEAPKASPSSEISKPITEVDELADSPADMSIDTVSPVKQEDLTYQLRPPKGEKDFAQWKSNLSRSSPDAMINIFKRDHPEWLW